MNNRWLLLSMGGLALVGAVGCSSGRDVTVSGEAKGAGTTAIDGAITLQFFEVPSAGETAATEPLTSIKLDKAGTFKQTVEVEGDKVRILGLADKDNDGKCTEGELWAEVEAPIANDVVQNVSLELTNAACPKPAN